MLKLSNADFFKTLIEMSKDLVEKVIIMKEEMRISSETLKPFKRNKQER